MPFKSPKFPLTVPGFTYLSRLDEIEETHNILLENFEIFIHCPECASMATLPGKDVVTCHCEKVKIDIVEGKIDKMERDWLVYIFR